MAATHYGQCQVLPRLRYLEVNEGMVRVKRVYEAPEPTDGARFLVERLWPRGMKKESLHMEGWLKDAAPSVALRQWFGHNPAKWDEFRLRYFAELAENPEGLRPLFDAIKRGNVTLLYSAHDALHNNALALKKYLEEHMEGNMGGHEESPRSLDQNKTIINVRSGESAPEGQSKGLELFRTPAPR